MPSFPQAISPTPSLSPPPLILHTAHVLKFKQAEDDIGTSDILIQYKDFFLPNWNKK